LVTLRGRIVHDLDRKLLTRTVELARAGDASAGSGCEAPDSSPLLGADRIEETWKLIGDALSAAVACAAKAVRPAPDAGDGGTGLKWVDRLETGAIPADLIGSTGLLRARVRGQCSRHVGKCGGNEPTRFARRKRSN